MPPRFVLQEHLDAQNATFKFFCTQAKQNVVWWEDPPMLSTYRLENPFWVCGFLKHVFEG